MKCTLKTLFVAISICCIHVALPSEFFDFSEPYWTKQNLQHKIEDLENTIDLFNRGMDAARLKIKPLLEEIKRSEMNISTLREVIRKAESRLSELE